MTVPGVDIVRDKAAQAALLAVAVQLVLVHGQADNLPLWRDRLGALLGDIVAPGDDMRAVVEAARAWVAASTPEQASAALWRLQMQLGWYYQRAAGARLETWRRTR